MKKNKIVSLDLKKEEIIKKMIGGMNCLIQDCLFEHFIENLEEPRRQLEYCFYLSQALLLSSASFITPVLENIDVEKREEIINEFMKNYKNNIKKGLNNEIKIISRKNNK